MIYFIWETDQSNRPNHPSGQNLPRPSTLPPPHLSFIFCTQRKGVGGEWLADGMRTSGSGFYPCKINKERFNVSPENNSVIQNHFNCQAHARMRNAASAPCTDGNNVPFSSSRHVESKWKKKLSDHDRNSASNSKTRENQTRIYCVRKIPFSFLYFLYLFIACFSNYKRRDLFYCVSGWSCHPFKNVLMVSNLLIYMGVLIQV